MKYFKPSIIVVLAIFCLSFNIKTDKTYAEDIIPIFLLSKVIGICCFYIIYAIIKKHLKD